MKMLRNLFKWIALGVAITAIVMAMAPEQGRAPHAALATAQYQDAVPAVIARVPLPNAVHVELERLVRPQAATQTGAAAGEETAPPETANVFGATSWYVPPPPPPLLPPVPPPPPSAPPLPFIYLGRYEDAPMRLAILVKGDHMYTVAEGEVIENIYRIERVTDGRVDLIYLPLNIRQTLGNDEAL